MADYVMKVVPAPPEGTTTVLLAGTAPQFRSSGPDDYFCGACGAKLFESVSPGQFSRLLIRCPTCAAHNSVDLLTPKGEAVSARPKRSPRKVRCVKCVHANIVINVDGRQPTLEFSAYEGRTVQLEPIDIKKYTWLVTCAKCGNTDVCILPLR
jgi:hypothetical protein